MAFLKFNKSELVNLSYSLKREIISANKIGAVCNTSIVTCNTRRYHGLLAVTLDRFGGQNYMLLSAVDESIVVNGKQFNLGIHCYGDIYEPRGHKYVVDFEADPVPTITYKVGEIVFKKSILLMPDSDQVLLKYELVKAPSKVSLILKPFLAFRNVHALTHRNDQANTSYNEIPGGASFRLYSGFPDLHLQLSSKSFEYHHSPDWYMGVTYSDEYRRGFDCREDLLVPGYFEGEMKKGESVILSASKNEIVPTSLKAKYTSTVKKTPEISDKRSQLEHCADLLITNHNGRKQINAGYSWLYTGMLRETLLSIVGLTLCRDGNAAEFEEILDNLIEDNQERLATRTTQVEAPLMIAGVLQKYIEEFGADPKKVWKKYGNVIKNVIESYLPGVRKEISMQPNGMLWAQMDGVALSWMNAYINGVPVTERSGYQVETNALWYNAICFAIEMEQKYGAKTSKFPETWAPVKALIEENYMKTFWYPKRGILADYVDNNGQNVDTRPNMLFALWVKYSPVPEEYYHSILRTIDNELVTRRGIRTLSPRNPMYRGVYEGTQIERDLAYHQGSTRPFFLEAYADVCFRVKGPAFFNKVQWLVKSFYEDLGKHGVGAFSELYDGDPPHEAHGAVSSALSTAALLAVDYLMEKHKED